MHTHFSASRIPVTVILFLSLSLFISAPATLAAGTTTSQATLSRQEFNKLSPAQQLSYIKSLAKNSQTISPTSQEVVGQLVADVTLRNCSYVQATSTSHAIHISCDISNKLGNQGDIHYGVQLLKRTSAGFPELIDTKVYDQALALRMDQTITQQIDYTPPSYLSGQYEVWSLLQTSDGLPLANYFLGKVTLEASTSPYLEIKSNSCILHVRGEAATTTYTTTQMVDVDSNEVLEGTCTVTAHTTGNTTITPSFITHQRSIFGEVVPDTQATQQTVTFNTNETKSISFVIPIASASQQYVAILSLVSPETPVVSNEVQIFYVVRGQSATIQNVVLDKDYYVAGDLAQVSVFWMGLPLGIRKLSTDTAAKTLTISIKDDNNNMCTRQTSFAIPDDVIERSKLVAHPLSITRLCSNPQVTVKILDAAGAPLASKTVSFVSGQIPERVTHEDLLKRQILWFGVVAFGVLLALGAVRYRRKRHHLV